MVGSQRNDAQPGLIRGARIQVVYSSTAVSLGALQDVNRKVAGAYLFGD